MGFWDLLFTSTMTVGRPEKEETLCKIHATEAGEQGRGIIMYKEHLPT